MTFTVLVMVWLYESDWPNCCLLYANKFVQLWEEIVTVLCIHHGIYYLFCIGRNRVRICNYYIIWLLHTIILIDNFLLKKKYRYFWRFTLILIFSFQKLKSLGYILMLFGSSVSLWVLTTFSNIFTNPMAETFVENWQYVLGYIVTAGVLSFAIVYRYGPVTDERSLSLIQWFLQLVGLVLVYNSTQIREVSIALIIILLTIYNFPRKFLLNERSKRWW